MYTALFWRQSRSTAARESADVSAHCSNTLPGIRQVKIYIRLGRISSRGRGSSY
ncbi:hypothetical protein DGI_2641 [Megalodesulfovibrio gigas DSM 1382 = ATCC 19364]|uniref:Uncharacterized protein n=1 Tax=Megalodesulfovibrio gigas (strain ATCC 19364 / DSM 1382 / NCIMB 9332 / VKM B-1759) TaxID=1121448 RepID=T2GEL6_MEGG1|nr:hypothetical protein DGI_2641 [Megalodesulfovibrio gigas DSM 1382 = ATCC 19364]